MHFRETMSLAALLCAAALQSHAENQPPIYLPDAEVWRYAVNPISERPGQATLVDLYKKLRGYTAAGDLAGAAAIRLDLADLLYRQSDLLASRATLVPATRYFTSIHDTRSLARCLSLDRLAAREQNRDSALSGASPIEEQVRAAAADNTIPTDLEPWLKLFDGYQSYVGSDEAAARKVWLETAATERYEPLVRGVAWLAASRARDADGHQDPASAHSYVAAARRIFLSANLRLGVASADLIEAELRSSEKDLAGVRRYAVAARQGFERAGCWRGMLTAQLELAHAELAAGNQQAALQATSESEKIANRYSPPAGNDASWRLSPADAARLVEEEKNIPALHRPKTAPPAVAAARKFYSWARQTGNPFVEIAGLRLLGSSLLAEGQWNDAIVYLVRLGEAQDQLVGRTSLRERLLQAARLDYLILSGEGLASAKQANYLTAATFMADFADACVGPLVEAEELDEDDVAEVHKRVDVVKKAAESAEAHRLRSIAQATKGRRAEAAHEIELEFQDAQALLTGLEKLSVKQEQSENDFGFPADTDDDSDSDSDTVPTRKEPVKLQPVLAYLKDLEKAMVLRDDGLVTRAAEELAKAIESGQPGTDKVEVPLVLGGGYVQGDPEPSNAASPSDWSGAVTLRLAEMQKRADSIPSIPGVPWGKIVADLSALGFEEATSTSLLGGNDEDLAKEQSAVYAGLYATQMAAAIAGNHNFIPLPRGITSLIHSKPMAIHWAGILANQATMAWFESLRGLPVSEIVRQEGFRKNVQGFITKALKAQDDDDDDDDEDADSSDDLRSAVAPRASEKSLMRSFVKETSLSERPALLLMLAGEQKDAESLASLMRAVQNELDRAAPNQPSSADLLGGGPTVAEQQRFIVMNLALYSIAAGKYADAVEQLRRIAGTVGVDNYQVQYALALCYRQLKASDEERKSLAAAVDAAEQLRRSMPTRNLALKLADIRQLLMEEYLGALERSGDGREMAAAIWKYRRSSRAPATVVRSVDTGGIFAFDVLKDLYDALSVGDVESPVTNSALRLTLGEFEIPEEGIPPGHPTLNGINTAMDAVIDELGGNPTHDAGLTATQAFRPVVEPNELLVFYFVGTRGLYTVTLDDAGVARPHYRVVDYRHLEDLCEKFRKGLAVNGSLDQTAATIYDLVLGYIPEVAGQRRLRILADGPLQLIPFQALRAGSDQPYLVETNSIAYIYGASRNSAGSPRERAPRNVLVIGNPTGDLTSSEEEARAIEKIPGSPPVTSLLGSMATTEAVRMHLADAGTVHFSTHAVRNANQPDFSFIRLAQGERVYSYDLANLDVRAKRVFLAACDTLVAETALGEDIYGLADAFIAAGSSSVIATLWKIDPDASARYAEEYYRALWGGNPEPEALAAADRLFLGKQSGELARPFFWAAFSFLSPLEFAASGQDTPTASTARADAQRERTAQMLETAVARVNALTTEMSELGGKLADAESANKDLQDKVAKLNDNADKAAETYRKTREEADNGKKASEELEKLKKTLEQVRQALIERASQAGVTARVFGTVIDRYGDKMGGAKLTIQDLDVPDKNAAPIQAEANDAGEYSAPGLPIGHRYKIEGKWTRETKTISGNMETTDSQSRHDETDEFVLSGDMRMDIKLRGVSSGRYSRSIDKKGKEK
jgi:CHAT domain-containing protein